MMSGLYPNQGTDRLKHRCIVCGINLFRRLHDNHPEPLVTPGFGSVEDRNDMFSCEGPSTSTHQTGLWFWRKTVTVALNAGCPDVTHLHRRCWRCTATWRERPVDRQQEMGKLLHLVQT
jgi:hypothetical protein